MMMITMIYRAESKEFKIDHGARKSYCGRSTPFTRCEGREEFSYSGQTLTNKHKSQKNRDVARPALLPPFPGLAGPV